MREIVHIQAGQCGNQIGAKVNIIRFCVQYAANRRRPIVFVRLQRPLRTVSANMADRSKRYCVVAGLHFAVRFPCCANVFHYSFRFPVKSCPTFSSTSTTTSPPRRFRFSSGCLLGRV